MTMIAIYSLMLYIYLLAAVNAAKKSMFAICDKDEDMRITKTELAVCMNVLPELDTVESNSHTKMTQLMNLIDTNNDGYISANEFQKATAKAQEAFDQEGYVEVTKADGSVQKVPKSELFNPMTGPGKGFEMKNDKVFKQEQHSGKIEELTSKDHALGNMIRIGQWTVAQLKELNITSGHLLKLESLPKGGSVVDQALLDKEPELLGVSFNGTFEVWMKLKLSNTSDPFGKPVHYEARVEYSREKYRSPFLAILEAWRLECAPGERDLRVEPLDLPPPRLQERFTTWLLNEFRSYAAHPYAGWIFGIFVALFIATIFI